MYFHPWWLLFLDQNSVMGKKLTSEPCFSSIQFFHILFLYSNNEALQQGVSVSLAKSSTAQRLF